MPSRHYLRFNFPYSHGLLSSLAWSALTTALTWIVLRSRRAALVIGATVFSHRLLDALVHVPALPIADERSFRAGLAPWNHMPLALTIEVLIAVAGIWVCLSGARWSGRNKIGVIVLTLAIVIVTVIRMTSAPAPANITRLAGVSLTAILTLVAAGGWFGRSPRY